MSARTPVPETRDPQTLLFDLSHHGKVELSGPEAASFLHNLCSNDVLRLAVGGGCEAFLLTAKARVVAHLLVYRIPVPEGGEALWLDTGPGGAEKVTQHLNRYLISEQVEIADRTADLAQFHVAGPDARGVLEAWLGQPLPDLKPLQHERRTVGMVPCQVRRHDPLGLPGYDVLCPAADAAGVGQALQAAGARQAGREVYEVLRVEAGTPAYGVDIDETHLAMETHRTAQAISFSKGCYLGQEPVVRSRDLGHVNRSFLGLRLSGDEPVVRGAKVFRDGKEVGQVTSSVYSPRVSAAIALAYLRRGSQEPGTAVEVETESGRRAATVASLPFTTPGAAAP
jgi:folate-binding protein YgfZ